MAAVTKLNHERSLYRIVRLVDKLFLMVNEQVTPLFLQSEEDNGQNVKLIAISRQDYTIPPFDLENTTKEAQLALLSHDYCITAVRDFAGLIAYAVTYLKIPLQIDEVHVKNVKAVRKVSLKVDYFEPMEVAGIHTMFRITRSSHTPKTLVPHEGFYVDPSAGQYYKKPGLICVADFQQDLAQESLLVEKSGSQYRIHLQEYCKPSEHWNRHKRISVYKTEVSVRNLNNIVYELLVEYNGLGALAEMTDSEWATKEKSIVQAVKYAVILLRGDLMRMEHENMPEEVYDKFAKGHFDLGHQKMVRAIEQVSGIPFDDLLAMGYDEARMREPRHQCGL